MAEHSANDPLWYGLDMGGTKIELAAFDARMQPLFCRRIDTPQGNYRGFIEAVAALVESADAQLGRRSDAVGLGLPGVRDRMTGLQLSSNVPALSGKPLGADLQSRIARPLALGNDAQCFALSEAMGGAADGAPSMFGAILGTGAGGGYCVEGRLVGGYNGFTSEWGHWTIPATLLRQHALPLLDCPCGLPGCVERYVSGTGLARIHHLIGGPSGDARTTIAQAQAGDPCAARARDIHLDLLGHALAALVLGLDPHVIVLGGGLSNDPALYRALPAAVARHLFAGARVPPILPPRFGDAGGARGAALLARQQTSRS